MKKILNSFEVYGATVCSLAMVTILFVNVVGRYIVNKSIPWAEEICLVLFIQSIFWGAAGAVRTRQHLRLEIILGTLKPKGRMILEIVDNIIFMIFNAIIIFGLMPLVIQLFTNGTAYAVTGLPKWISYVWLPIMFALMEVRLIQDCIQHVKDYKDDPTGEKRHAKEIAAMQASLEDDAAEEEA